MLPNYNEEKATQLAVLLLQGLQGQSDRITLLKLMYIADREALSRWGFPITCDMAISMKNGPVLSATYDRIKSNDTNNRWSQSIQNTGSFGLKIADNANASLDNLSPKEIELVQEILAQYGEKEQWELVEMTHEFPEWHKPQGAVLPIHWSEILAAKGIDQTQSNEILCEIEAFAALDNILERFA